MLILNIYIKKEVILFPESCILLEYINLLGGEDSRCRGVLALCQRAEDEPKLNPQWHMGETKKTKGGRGFMHTLI